MRKTGAHRFKGYASAISGGLVALLVTTLAAASAQADLPAENADGWSLRKEADNIRVYTIDQHGSSFKAFKAVATLDAPIETVMAVMMNPQSCVEWVYNCIESYAFGSGTFHDRYAYSVNDMPWPVTDRDYVLHIRTQGNRNSGEIVMDLNATPNQRAGIDNRVRVDHSDTLYRFIPEGDKTRMVWLQHTDPNGALPGWLVNSLLVDIPVRSLKALEQVAGKDRYQNFELIYNDQDELVDVRTTEH
ncbi:START domain-containing protein [Marinobacter alexandrii]|uniref:START domain-containing protein n=1 Tax=Marinobacter alexandrii TaxID=2570351 RepID=UPI0011083EF1|nr:START domain-containing protein [Marinobacter alexandrii]